MQPVGRDAPGAPTAVGRDAPGAPIKTSACVIFLLTQAFFCVIVSIVEQLFNCSIGEKV